MSQPSTGQGNADTGGASGSGGGESSSVQGAGGPRLDKPTKPPQRGVVKKQIWADLTRPFSSSSSTAA